MSNTPDTRFSLIARMCVDGDDDAWAEFVQIYEPVVHRLIQRQGFQHADTVELTQDVMTRVAQSISVWDQDHASSSFRGWLYRITRNLTIDFLRQRSAQPTHARRADVSMSDLPGPEGPESRAFQMEHEKQLFYWAAGKLQSTCKPANWQAFWLSAVDGVPIEEVADRLSLSPGAIYVARSRIMARFSKLIQKRLDEVSRETDLRVGRDTL